MTDNASLIGLSRQTALRRQMDILANNLANLGTSGFRAEKLLFAEHLMPSARAEGPGGRPLSYVVDSNSILDLASGPIQTTGNPLDVAVGGEGWLVVETAQGERYTRNGSLQIAADGTLVTSGGHPVLGMGGPLAFAEDETEITIAADGTVSTDRGEKDRLRVVTFDDPSALEPEGASLFSSPIAPAPVEHVQLSQGMLEGSNVQPILEMSRMIEVTRSYTTLARMLEKSDELRQQAISTLGRVE